MKLNFKQGIVQYHKPEFLSVGTTHVDLLATDTPLVVALCDAEKTYLHIEQKDQANAWVISPGVDQWLYWDIDRRTGLRSFGVTVVAPVIQVAAPPTPVTDTHWFNPDTDEMSVWTGSRWAPALRVFACKLAGGAVPISMSINSPLFDGTQSGDTSENFAGQILFDANSGLPLKTPDGKFVTTEDQLRLDTIATSDLKIAAMVFTAEAQQTLPAYTVVAFNDFNSVVHANQFTTQLPGQIGIIQTSALPGDFVNVVTEGIITNPSWNWPTVNAYLYADAAGTLVTTPPVTGAVPIATVIGASTIMFGSPRINVAIDSGAVVTAPATTLTLGTVRLATAPVDPATPIAVGTNDPRMTDARVPLAHLHTEADVTNLTTDLAARVLKAGDAMTGTLILSADPVLNLEAATKQYVDTTSAASAVGKADAVHTHTEADVTNLTTDLAARVLKAGDAMTGFLTLNANPTNILHAATKQYVDAADAAVTASRAPLVHTHTEADVTNLTTDLAARVLKAGDVMTGFLLLNADPISNLHPATKQYVDAVSVTVGGKVDRSGDTMTGSLILAADPTLNLGAATKQYVDAAAATKLNTTGGTLTGHLTLSGDPTAALQAATKQYVDAADITKVNRGGDTMSGYLTLVSDPAGNLHAATKQYVDNTVSLAINSKLSLTGGVLSGTLTLAADPTNNLEAATKKYVDDAVAGVSGGSGAYVPLAGGTMTGALVLSGAPQNNLEASTKLYVDDGLSNKSDASHNHDSAYVIKSGDTMTGMLTLFADPTGNKHAATKEYVDTAVVGKLNTTGGTLTGALTLSGDPVTNLQAATKQYVDNADALKLNLSGGTLTGALTLAGAPTTNLEAATKQYVDDAVAGVSGGAGAYVPLAGGTMTGLLELSGEPVVDFGAATKKYVDDAIVGVSGGVSGAYLPLTGGTLTGALTLAADPISNFQAATKQYVDGYHDVTKLNVAGGTLTGALTLSTDPVTNLQAATKQYVDNSTSTISNKVDRTGDAMSGFLTLAADPTLDLHAATKYYVDNHHDAAKLNVAGGTMTGVLTLSADPAANLEAATKQYVDTGLAGKSNTTHNHDSAYVIKSGDTMVGFLTLNDNPTNPLHATPKQYVDTGLNTKANVVHNHDSAYVIKSGDTMTGSLVLAADPTTNLEAATKQYVDATMATASGAFVPLAGGTMTGTLVLSANPATALEAATKQYVDGYHDASKLNLTGGTLTGGLVLPGDPVIALEAATKQYVDNQDALLAPLAHTHVEADITGLTTDLAARVLKAGDTMTGALVLSGAPTIDLHAATKKYVDDAITWVSGGTIDGGTY